MACKPTPEELVALGPNPSDWALRKFRGSVGPRPEHDNRPRPDRKRPSRPQPGRKRPSDPRKPEELTPFIAIDGEALGRSGYHLLAASTGERLANPEQGLTSEECLGWLLDLKRGHKRGIFVGFALGYDCEHWIHDFGPDLWESIRQTNRGVVTIRGKRYLLEYLPRKWFKLGLLPKHSPDWRDENGKPERDHWLVQVYDVFSFFQQSFVSVVGSPATGQAKGWNVATAEEIAFLTEWKAARGEFKRSEWNDIIRYNDVECRVLVRLMNRLRQALDDIGIRLKSWHGPGAVANALLKRYNQARYIPRPIDVPEEVRDALQRAYFGGRFQVFQLGHHPEIFDYDLSSAYPYATSLLPSATGEWTPVEEYQGDDAPWCLYLCSWDVPLGSIPPFSWRDKNGFIHYPSTGCGWYWSWEVSAARRGYGNAIRVERGWRLYPEAEGVFGWMNELAAARVAAKQAAKSAEGEQRERFQAKERALKLALNSVYGKVIQTVGQFRPYLCPTWAGLITARTRATLLENALLDPEAVVCFATDGLFTTRPVAVFPEGKGLGEWELAAEGVELRLYQSGCYALIKDGEYTDTRFRGIARKDIPWEPLWNAWEQDRTAGKVTVTTNRFVGHRTALAQGMPELQCQWIDMAKEIELRPGVGFTLPHLWEEERSSVRWYTETPHCCNYLEPSHPYRKLWELENPDLDEEEVQP